MPIPENDKFVPAPSRSMGWLLVLFVLHIPLALIIHQYSILATLHALSIFMLGLYYALTGKPIFVAYMGAYIVGAEVLWRMTDSLIFHEFGKYTLSLLFVLALLRQRRFMVSVPAVLYFVLMLPAITLVLSAYSFYAARDMISFNLAGPMALTISILFFSNVTLSRDQIINVFYAALLPLVGIATLALYVMATTPGLTFSLHSALSRSGGYAPNQVSAVLGLGALLAYLILAVAETVPFGLKIILGAIVLWLAAQSSLTFSRAGVISAGISMVLASFFIFQQRTHRARFVVLVLLGLGGLVILPRLIELTGGSIITRFTNMDPTGRDLILQTDLQIWRSATWFGVGPGVSTLIRPLGIVAASHTEFTRVLAEHGILGLFSNVMFLVLAWQAWVRSKEKLNKGIVTALLCWTIFFMAESATRVVAPSFLFGLAFAFEHAQDNIHVTQFGDRPPVVRSARFQRGRPS